MPALQEKRRDGGVGDAGGSETRPYWEFSRWRAQERRGDFVELRWGWWASNSHTSRRK